MQEQILSVFQQIWENLLLLVPNILLAVLTLIITFLIANNVSSTLHSNLAKHTSDELLARFLSRLAKILIVVSGLIVITNLLGLTGIANGLVASAGVSAFIIGFAFKDIGENFLSGMMLAFKRPFKIGDSVETSGITGTITALDLSITQVKTADGNTVHIPNSLIQKNPLTILKNK